MSNVTDLIGRATDLLNRSGVPSARLDAEVLLAHALDIERASLLARTGEPVPASAASRFDEMLRMRVNRVPVAYITGRKEFWSLEFEVTEDVLVPRPETEHVVEEVLDRVRRHDTAVIADVGTGAGPIAVTLARELPESEIHATDISGKALEVARRNAARNGVEARIRFHEGDLLEPVLAAGLTGRLDVVVSNPPYVARSESVVDEVRCEPEVAVYGGAEGTEVIERLIPQARRALRPGGTLILEMTFAREAFLLTTLGGDPGWLDVEMLPDLAGLPRVCVATRAKRSKVLREGEGP